VSELATSTGVEGFRYPGDELELFQHAVNWKRYVASQLASYLVGDVAEVGAGLGATTALLVDGTQASWVCLEPDVELAAKLRSRLRAFSSSTPVEVLTGTLREAGSGRRFDTVVYIDVLEHIEHDREELEHAAERLRPGGRLLVLSPAHQWLYSPFDRALGHFRRYSAETLAALTPATLQVERVFYLDSVGLLASFANRLLLGQQQPTRSQILFWDSVLVRLSRFVDVLFAYRLGKSVVAIWRRVALT